jgi:hypothetical protein
MAIYEIPTEPTGPAWTQETQLEGQTYVLEFRWNTRDSSWYLSLYDVDGSVLVAGLRLRHAAPTLRHVADLGKRPPGELILVGSEATYDNFGKEAQLLYVERETVEEILGV